MPIMNYEFGIVVVTNPVKNNLAILAKAVDIEADGMFIRGLSPTGIAPATAWISNGMMPIRFLAAMRDPVKMYTFAKKTYDDNQQVFPYTQLQVTNALGNCTVSDGTFFNGTTTVAEDAFALIARLGLQFVVP